MSEDQRRLLPVFCCFLLFLPAFCQSPCNDLWWGGLRSQKCFFDFRSSTTDIIYPDLTGITYTSEEGSAAYSLNGRIILYSDGLKLIDNRLVPPVVVSSTLPGDLSSCEPVAMFPLTGSCSADLIGLVINSQSTTTLFGVDITAIPAQLRWSTPLIQSNGTEALEIVEIPIFPPEQWILLLSYNTSGIYLNAIHISSVGVEVERVITYLSFRIGTCGVIDYNKYSGMLAITQCSRIFLCNFNILTGVATNVVEISAPPGGLVGWDAVLPGQGRYLYFTSGTTLVYQNLRIYQIDLQDPLLQAFSLTPAVYSGMTEGPNGKLYLSAISQGFIGVISNPAARWQDITLYTVTLPAGCVSSYFFGQKTFCFEDFPPRILCSASSTATISTTRSLSKTKSLSSTSTYTRSPSKTQSPSTTSTKTRSHSGTQSPSTTKTRSPSITQSLSATSTKTRSASKTQSPSTTSSKTRSPSRTQSLSSTFTYTRSPSKTQSPSTTSTETRSASKTQSLSTTTTNTRSASRTPSLSATFTKTRSASKTQSPSTTSTYTRSTSKTQSPSTTTTKTRSPSRTQSPSTPSTETLSPSTTQSLSATTTNSRSSSKTQSPSTTSTSTRSPSKTQSLSTTTTKTRSASRTPSPSTTKTRSPSRMPSLSATSTETHSPSKIQSLSATSTKTRSTSKIQSLSATSTKTRSPSRTQSATNTATRLLTPHYTSSRSASPTMSTTNSISRTATVTTSSVLFDSIAFSPTSTRFPTSSLSFSPSTSSSGLLSQIVPTSSSSQSSGKTTSNTVSSTNSMNPALPPQEVSAAVINGIRVASTSPSPVMAYLLSSPTPQSSVFVTVILPNNEPTAVDIIIQPGDAVAIDNLPFTSNPKARTEVYDITLHDQYGVSIQPSSPVEICFIVSNIGVRESDLCLASYSENTEKWKCDDCVRRKKEGSSEYLCGQTSHLTNFAILLSGDVGAKRNCDSDSEINVALAYTALGCILFCLLFIAVTLVISRTTPILKLVRGNEGNRAAKLRLLALRS